MGHELKLFVVAHGAGDDSGANAIANRIAAGLRSSFAGFDVTTAFKMGTPTIEETVANAGVGDVVVPIMTADGYFVNRLVPSLFAGTGATVTAPLGATTSLDSLVAQALRRFLNGNGVDASETDVVVIGHGTRRSSSSGRTAHRLGTSIESLIPGLRTRVGFIDQDPSIESALDGASRSAVVVLPFLIGGGGHAEEDIPDRVGAHPVGRRAVVLPALDDFIDLDGLTRGVVETTVQRLPLRLGTRSSKLAMRQAEMTRDALAGAGVPSVIVPLETLGDRDLDRPIEQFETSGPFTDDLEIALRRGDIDVAVHSLKDLPLEDRDTLPVVAVLERDEVEEILVTRDRVGLDGLPHGAVIGTSSARRAAQLLLLRPDLRVRSIRGAVDSRIRQVDSGAFDGAVLAEAGLSRMGWSDRIDDRFAVDDFLPQAGQAVIALQVRSADWFATSLVSRVDHAATRLATAAELRFARIAEEAGFASAAYATIDGDIVRLDGALIGSQGSIERMSSCDVVEGDARSIGESAARVLLDRVRGKGDAAA